MKFSLQRETVIRPSVAHLTLVFGTRGALASAAALPRWNHSDLLYWHAAVSTATPPHGQSLIAVPRLKVISPLCPICEN